MERRYDVFILGFTEAEAKKVESIARDVLPKYIETGEVRIINSEKDFPRKSWKILIVKAQNLQDTVNWVATEVIDDEYYYEMWDLIIVYNGEVASGGCYTYTEELCSRIRECIAPAGK